MNMEPIAPTFLIGNEIEPIKLKKYACSFSSLIKPKLRNASVKRFEINSFKK